MSELDPNQMESDLRTLKPALAPPEVLDRVLLRLASRPETVSKTVQKQSWLLRQVRVRARWWIPATAAAVAATVLLRVPGRQREGQINSQVAHPVVSSTPKMLRADKVEIERQLLAKFDAIGKLPTGEPVRFRCEQWMDKVQLRDSAAGMVIERTVPRLEIVPIRFETY